MAMLVTLDNMKNRLGIDLGNTDYDAFLTEQITLISDSVEGYCGRIFNEATYVQTFYSDDLADIKDHLYLYHYPVTTLTAVVDQDAVTVDSDTYRLHYPTAKFKYTTGYINVDFKELVITYDAGYPIIPTPIAEVVYSLVEERYNKKVSGVDLSFGSDVQRVSIPGAISIDFDYTLQSNERKVAFGMFLGNYVNVLDKYRSERPILGSIGDNYVQ